MTAEHAIGRIVQIIRKHRTRAEAAHEDSDEMGPAELRGLDEWDASENDSVLRDVESVVDAYCATMNNERR